MTLACACGRQFAPDLPVCPDCNRPARSPGRKRGKLRLAGGIFAAFVLAVLMLLFWAGLYIDVRELGLH